jgi:predicted ATP-dependent serine protease
MDLKLKTTQFIPARDIVIPDVFYRRMKTGIIEIDELFGEGILPGSTITLTAMPGCGKTTLLLQILESLAFNGYETGYASSEESLYQLRFAAKRLNVNNINMANISDIDTLIGCMDDLDVMVVDSFQGLTSKEEMNTRELEKYAVSEITKAAKEKECTVFFIMHLTKTGQIKGGTIVPHTVDVNMRIDVSDADESIRTISFTKNRFGPCNELSLYLDGKGYNFNEKVTIEEFFSKKTNNKSKQMDKILQMKEPPHITSDRVMKELDVDYQRAYYLLRELVNNNKLCKYGKGKNAIYKLVEL